MNFTIQDRIVESSRSLPELIEKARALDPPMAEALTGKALAQSRTVWGVLAALALAETVRRLDLGWGPDLIALISGLIVMGATIALRWISAGPITGWFSRKSINGATA